MGEALRGAVRDFYEESWRFVALNSVISAYVLGVLAVAAVFGRARAASGRGAASRCARLRGRHRGRDRFAHVHRDDRGSPPLLRARARARSDARIGILATVVAFRFYGDAGVLAWPLAVLVVYLIAVFVVYQIHLWPLAVREPERPLGEVVPEAGIALARRPWTTLGLGLALLAVNLIGLVLAVLPFLTMTIAYSALICRFALPLRAAEEEKPWRT